MISMIEHRLTADLAERFVRIALRHVTREYPHKLDHVLERDADAKTPRALHPIFHGSFDWHSCVHGYWLLARLLRRFPENAAALEIRALFDASFTTAKVEAERAYLDGPSTRGFERPYGWAWLLMLQTELVQHKSAPWADTMRPLADAFAERFKVFLPLADYPVRNGSHASTAFALRLVMDYADAAGDEALTQLAQQKCRQWYGADADARAWEPSGDDFLSPTLIEAACMRRALPAEDFAPWFARFLPRLAEGEPASLFTPATVSDRSDGKTAHLDGLNLSRAWCFRELAKALPPGDPRAASMHAAAEAHLAASLPHVAGDYMGEHWLPSFALLALEA